MKDELEQYTFHNQMTRVFQSDDDYFDHDSSHYSVEPIAYEDWVEQKLLDEGN